MHVRRKLYIAPHIAPRLPSWLAIALVLDPRDFGMEVGPVAFEEKSFIKIIHSL